MTPMLRTHQAACTAKTLDAPDFVDITSSVQSALESSGIRDGQVTLFCPDESCTILVNELETGLLTDLRRAMERVRSLWPRAVIGARSVVVPAHEGRLRLGTWQRLLLLELDHPGTRRVVVQILGDG